MGIFSNIKQKTDSQKKLISLSVAVIITLIIVVVWFSFSNISVDNKIAGTDSDKLSSISPIQVIKDEVAKIFTSFSNITAEKPVENILSSSTLPVEIIIEGTSTATSSEMSTTSNNII